MAKKKTSKSAGAKKKSSSKKKAAAKKPASRKKVSAKKKPSSKTKAKKPARSKKGGKGWLNLEWLTGTTGIVAAVATAGVIGFMSMQWTPSRAPSATGAPLAREFKKAQKYDSVGERVAYWSGQLLKANVHQGKLFELLDGKSVPDSAPLVPKRFNCTTFVETIAALARADQPGEVYNKLLEIRYKNSDPTFFHRNHFPEADWIPNNIDAGVLEDVTGRIADSAGIKVGYESKVIDKAEWLKSLARTGKVSRSLASSARDSWAKSVPVKVAYLPIDKITEFYDDLPQGAVINLVRKDSRNRPVLITHQGVIVKKGDKVFFRHSTPNGYLKTVPLPDYLVGVAKRSPSLIGINVNVLKG